MGIKLSSSKGVMSTYLGNFRDFFLGVSQIFGLATSGTSQPRQIVFYENVTLLHMTWDEYTVADKQSHLILYLSVPLFCWYSPRIFLFVFQI